MELKNLSETLAAIITPDMLGLDYTELCLMKAVKNAGYWLDNVEYPDIASGSVGGLITYRERREFAQEWADDIDNFVDADYLDLEGIETLDDAYARYCQAAVSWAYGKLESALDGAADISPEMLEELTECAQNARELDEDGVWSDKGLEILPGEDLEALDSEPAMAEDVFDIWLTDASAETWKVRDKSGAAAGVMLVGDGRALWFPDASHRHA
jgi:hypothetical protein|uniref:Uncharacterized protein n=1 Tax=Podoviridae sp. ctRnx2 TaxID=2826555 RepID=A0A8S5QRY2_9CAUD|nr:MAG TPA: hypothetical protein [Podoviridae sp. ctRnx2]